MKILFKSGIYQLMILVVMGLLVTSCSKDKKDDPVPGMEGEALIKMHVSAPMDIQVAKLTSPDIPSGVKKASTNTNSSQLDEGLRGFVAYDDFEVRTKFYAPQVDQAATANKAATSNVTVARTPLLKKYRVLMYKAGATTPAINVVVTPGIDPLIKVDAGVSYKMVVFSTNTDAVPNVTGATNTVAAADLANKDVLYYTTTLTTLFGDNDIDVLLERKTTRVNLEMDVRGLHGGIYSTTKIDLGFGSGAAFATIMKTAPLDLFNGSFGTTSNVAPVAFSTVQFTETTGSGFGPLQGVMSFYTIGTTVVPANQFKVKLADLVLWTDIIQAGDPPAPKNIYTTYTGTFTFAAGASNPGFTTTAGTEFGASAEFQLPKIIINNKIWAPANLVYEPNFSTDYPYRFKPDNDMDPYDASAASSFWNWRAMTPVNTAAVNQGDPCLKVFPVNTWRMPTEAELQGLIDAIPAQTFLGPPVPASHYVADIGLLLGADIRYVWNKAAANRLDLRMYGYRSAGTGTASYGGKPLAALLGILGGFGSANYWSSTASGSNAKFFEGKYEGFLGVLPQTQRPTMQTGAQNIGRNIRCIRENI